MTTTNTHPGTAARRAKRPVAPKPAETKKRLKPEEVEKPTRCGAAMRAAHRPGVPRARSADGDVPPRSHAGPDHHPASNSTPKGDPHDSLDSQSHRPRPPPLRRPGPGPAPARRAGRSLPAVCHHHRVPRPDRQCRPLEITAGPDGNLWFTEFGSRQDRDDQPDDPRHHRVPHPHRQLRSRSDHGGPRRQPLVHRVRTATRSG